MEKDIELALEDIKNSLKTSCNNEAFWSDFIKPLKVLQIKDNRILLKTKNAFAKQILENEYCETLEKRLSSSLGSQVFVDFSVHDHTTKTESPSSFVTIKNTNINNNFVFDRFVVGGFNKLAYNAAQSLFGNSIWNPIFINGGVGLGKTHLLHAIGNKFLRSFPQKTIKYVTSDEFSRSVYGALSSNTIEELKNEYEQYDLLLFDDVQFLSNKEKINEIFFNIFNNNLSKNKIIVLASDKNPKDLIHFNERMRSRFASGLVIPITKPDLESLKIILEHKIKEIDNSFHFTKECIDYIVRRNNNDIRQLEGCLHQILFYASSFFPPNSVIGIENIKKIFSFPESGDKNLGFDFDPELVIKQVCDVYHTPPDVLKGKKRTKEISLVRQVCMYVLKEKFPKMSLVAIGGAFGGRDHSTVIESLEKIKSLMQKDKSFGDFIKNLINKI